MPTTAAGTTISTLGDLLDSGYSMHFTCRNRECLRDTFEVDIAKLIAIYGRDGSYIRGKTRIRVKCRECGKRCSDFIVIARR